MSLNDNIWMLICGKMLTNFTLSQFCCCVINLKFNGLKQQKSFYYSNSSRSWLDSARFSLGGCHVFVVIFWQGLKSPWRYTHAWCCQLDFIWASLQHDGWVPERPSESCVVFYDLVYKPHSVIFAYFLWLCIYMLAIVYKCTNIYDIHTQIKWMHMCMWPSLLETIKTNFFHSMILHFQLVDWESYAIPPHGDMTVPWELYVPFFCHLLLLPDVSCSLIFEIFLLCY